MLKKENYSHRFGQGQLTFDDLNALNGFDKMY